MNAAQIIDALAEHGARVAVDGDRVRLHHPAGKTLPVMLLDAARTHKAELRALVGQRELATAEMPASRTAPPQSFGRDTCPAEWREGFAALDANRPPINFPPSSWRGVIRDAELFLATWGRRAEDLGWDSLSLFGAHRRAPDARYSHKGLLMMIGGGRVVALTTASAVIEQQSGARLTYTRRPPEAECVPLWELPFPT